MKRDNLNKVEESSFKKSSFQAGRDTLKKDKKHEINKVEEKGEILYDETCEVW